MSIELSSVAQEIWDSEVKQAFQAGLETAVLGGKLRTRNGFKGKTYHWRTIGEGLATERTAPQSDVIPMDIAHDTVPCTLKNWDASEYTDIFDEAEVNFDERRELATVIGASLRRRQDQICIDALEAATPIDTIVDGSANLTTAKMRQAKFLMDKYNVPTQDRVMLVHASQLEGLLAETETTSSDFNTIQALVHGELNTWLNFEIIALGDRKEGGLAFSNPVRTCLAFQRLAGGYVSGLEVTGRVDYVPEKKSWLSTGHLRAGAVGIPDAKESSIKALIKIDCDETPTP